jgi:hypothetical protein
MTVAWTQGTGNQSDSGTLTIGNGSMTETFTLEGHYNNNNFVLQHDSGTGTEVAFNTTVAFSDLNVLIVGADSSGYPISQLSGPETVDPQIACRVCNGPLAAREGQFVLKSFLLREASRLDARRALQGFLRAKPRVDEFRDHPLGD